ncbi:hypothetical protein ATK17_1818 [Branchiibius hedensis]|uniref:Uncharacterized protein n=1 Tax=Branchiibius hedensis TaxID=672460 RepID=A0A2Y8ZRI1_9MICO|nr:hypothetical protein [Branchiibius hedensis]PWJ25682.1 hypothetical protein ATK17_1818 [Branchiibius hedensis]SSA34495.1 hypothetical protein SAMN04489750_1818 [Branchiibius hedensis]
MVAGEPGFDAPVDVAVRWILTMSDPLIPPGYRERMDAQMSAQISVQPQWGSFFLGGAISDLIHTLPSEDPWRSISARFGDHAIGDKAPGFDGAVTDDGAPFGTYLNALDVSGQVMAYPEIDPGLIAFAQDLMPASCYALACGALSHTEAAEALRAALVPLGSYDAGDDDQQDAVGAAVIHPEVPPEGSGALLVEAGLPALRWAAARRRSYLDSFDDGYLFEVLARWSHLAGRLAAGEDPGEDQWRLIAARNEQNAIEPLPADDF